MPSATFILLVGMAALKRKHQEILRITSWNVAGLNACLKKGFNEFTAADDSDILLIQETKLGQGKEMLAKYPWQYWSHSKSKKGYSGCAVFSKIKPMSVSYDLGDELDQEGRYIILEFPQYFLINCYIMNAGQDLKRLPLKRLHYGTLEAFLSNLSKPFVLAGDLNVAHTEHDLARPKTNSKYFCLTVELLGSRPKSAKISQTCWKDSTL